MMFVFVFIQKKNNTGTFSTHKQELLETKCTVAVEPVTTKNQLFTTVRQNSPRVPQRCLPLCWSVLLHCFVSKVITVKPYTFTPIFVSFRLSCVSMYIKFASLSSRDLALHFFFYSVDPPRTRPYSIPYSYQPFAYMAELLQNLTINSITLL